MVTPAAASAYSGPVTCSLPPGHRFFPSIPHLQTTRPRKVAKYAILMTDGEFNTAFADVAEGGKIHEQDTKARNAAQTHCAAMKKDGIEIFTIGFMLNQSAAKAVLKNCSSPDKSAIKHYYEVSTGAALDQAFKDIAANIERLAIVK
jgi:hypothetical protein